MTEVSFYHLTSSSVEIALPSLLKKALQNNKKSLIVIPEDNILKKLDKHLWEYKTDSFLPHGTSNDSFAENQPILLSSNEENSNNSEFLFALKGASSEFIKRFERYFDIFNGFDENEVIEARKRWKKYKEDGFNLIYWKQDSNGKWQKEA